MSGLKIDPIIKEISVEIDKLFIKDIKDIILSYYSFSCDICEKELCLNNNDDCVKKRCFFAKKTEEKYNCTPFLCSNCKKIICGDCGMECHYGCRKEFCELCSETCKSCGEEVCVKCIDIDKTDHDCDIYYSDPYGFGFGVH
jgi:hypothetical protein